MAAYRVASYFKTTRTKARVTEDQEFPGPWGRRGGMQMSIGRKYLSQGKRTVPVIYGG